MKSELGTGIWGLLAANSAALWRHASSVLHIILLCPPTLVPAKYKYKTSSFLEIEL